MDSRRRAEMARRESESEPSTVACRSFDIAPPRRLGAPWRVDGCGGGAAAAADDSTTVAVTSSASRLHTDSPHRDLVSVIVLSNTVSHCAASRYQHRSSTARVAKSVLPNTSAQLTTAPPTPHQQYQCTLNEKLPGPLNFNNNNNNNSDSDDKSASRNGARVRRFRLLRLSYLRNVASFLAFTTLFTVANAAMFVARALQYSDRHWLEQLARGTGYCLNLDCALVLVLVLRKLLTWLRSRRVGQLLPLEQHIYLHKMAGWTVYVLSIVHTLCHMANFVVMSSASGVSVYDYLFDTTMNIGWFVGSANITGIALLIILTVMVACSHRAVRKSGYFEVFYWTHLLSIPTWVLLVLHSPNFWKWFLAPGCLFLVEVVSRMQKVCSDKGRSLITSAAVMPSEVVKLTVKRPEGFRFNAGDFCYVNVPSVAKYEWHPFTISSSPENDEEITFHVRAVGEWTRSLHSKVADACFRTYFSNQWKEHYESSVLHAQISAPPFQTLQDSRGIRPILPKYGASPEHFSKTYRPREVGQSPREIPAHDVEQCVDVSDSSAELEEGVGIVKNPSVPENDIERRLLSRGTNRVGVGGFDNAAYQVTDHVQLSSQPASERNTTVLLITSDQGTQLAAETASSAGGICLQQQQQRQQQQQQEQQRQQQRQRQEQQLASGRLKHSAIQHGQCDNLQWKVVLDGPFGAPSTSIFHSEHAVMVAAGIGVTPFASVLHCISDRYNAAHRPCPYCSVPTCLEMPPSLLKLKKVDFVWVNRDMSSFEWFLELLHELVQSQRRPGSVLDTFLSVQLYKTSSSALVGALPLRDQVKQGRPNWDQVFGEIKRKKRGRVSVFYCGPPALASLIRDKATQYGFAFVKEMF